MTAFTENWREVLTAFGITIEMTILGGIIAIVVGFGLAALRVSPIPLGRGVAMTYVRLVRNTPLLLIMILLAFTLPDLELRPAVNLNQLLGLNNPQRLLSFNFFFVSATLALGLYTAAFVCEAVRSGVNSIDMGQAEAARSVGMTFGQTISTVVLPQAFRAVIPPLVSILIAMTKNSSLATGVGVTQAAFAMGKLTNDYASQTLVIFFGFALGYIVLVAIISTVGNVLERRVGTA